MPNGISRPYSSQIKTTKEKRLKMIAVLVVVLAIIIGTALYFLSSHGNGVLGATAIALSAWPIESKARTIDE